MTSQRSESRHLFPVYAQIPHRFVAGDGVTLVTSDRREFLDFYGGHAVAGLGHRHPDVLARMESAASRLFFQTNAAPLADRAAAAEALCRFAPKGLDRAFFVNSGAEANENALRLAFRARPGRETVVAVEGGFHGRTAAAAAVTTGSDRWDAFPRRPFAVRTVPRNDADAMRAAVDGGTAAVILEPVQGMAGAFVLEDLFLEAAREACDAAGAVLIFDEVQCGMGRTGRPFACDWTPVRPDILTTAKALAAGFPAGAVLATDEIAGGLPIGALGTTFGGGPIAAALIRTVIRVIERDRLLARVRRLSDRIREEAVLGPVRGVHGRGFLLGLVCSRPAREVRDALLDRNILAGTSADPMVLRLLPPLILEDRHVETLVNALGSVPADGAS